MPRGAKRDRSATKGRGFRDRCSFVSLDGHDYLRGEDMGLRRNNVFERDGGRCLTCGAWYGEATGHVHHLQSGLVGRCDCFHNLEWSCPKCHRQKHVQTQWSKR